MTHARNRFMGLGAIACLVFATAAVADTVQMKSGLKFEECKVIGIQDGQIELQLQSGLPTKKVLTDVSKVVISDEPSFTEAETLYNTQNWAKAGEAYQKTVNATQKDWLRKWAEWRLMDSGSRSDRFDLTSAGYVRLLIDDPTTAKRYQLVLPQADSAYIPIASALITSVLNDSKIKPETRLDLLDLNYRLEVKKGDNAAADKTLEEIAKLNPNHPIAKQALQRKFLSTVDADLKAKAYDKVIAAVGAKEADALIDPSDQASLLYMRAEAMAGQAQTKGGDAWKEVALAYMLVAINFPSSTPHVSDCYLKTADILEKQLKDTKGALKLYQQVATEFRGQPAGQQAAEQVKRLGS